jgi:hypothetical protein
MEGLRRVKPPLKALLAICSSWVIPCKLSLLLVSFLVLGERLLTQISDQIIIPSSLTIPTVLFSQVLVLDASSSGEHKVKVTQLSVKTWANIESLMPKASND